MVLYNRTTMLGVTVYVGYNERRSGAFTEIVCRSGSAMGMVN